MLFWLQISKNYVNYISGDNFSSLNGNAVCEAVSTSELKVLTLIKVVLKKKSHAKPPVLNNPK